MDQEILLALYTYNTYANRLVLDTVEQLTEEEFTRQSSPSHDSVQTLLLHLLGVETFFLKQCQGQPVPPRPDRPPTLADMRAYCNRLAGEQEAFVKSLAASDLKREVRYRYEVGGHQLQLPVWQLLLQAFVHSTHHRGELSIVLSRLGRPLPTLDIIIPFVKQSGQEWPWP